MKNKKLKEFKRKISKIYYKVIHNIETFNYKKTHHPKLGKGKFVSVYKKGAYTDIFDEETKETFRLIPYQPNHGIFVELIDKNGKIKSRQVLSTREMRKFLNVGNENC